MVTTLHEPRWSDLETKGYVIVPKFLQDEELLRAREDFSQLPRHPNQIYPVFESSKDRLGPIAENAEDVAARVRGHTRFRVDLFVSAIYFSTSAGVDFKWHQDHESYFIHQNHLDYLNFYVPIVKPDKTRSGLAIVPFDAVLEKYPSSMPQIYGKGARRYFPRAKLTLVVDDSTDDDSLLLGFNLEELAIAPELEAGDLLLMRGDMIHRTQDVDTPRVSLSMRMTHGDGLITRHTFQAGGENKRRAIAANPTLYGDVSRALERSPRGELTNVELVKIMRTPPT
jgi:hypothetical protein